MNTIIATNPSGLSTEELKQVRIKLIGIGQALYGRRICYPISDNLDLNHGRKEKGEIEGLRLSSPLKKYFVEAKDITSVDIVTTANGKTVFEFNHDANLQFPLSADLSDIVKAEAKDVHAAIKLFEMTGQKTFFCNVQMVTDTVTQLNRSNIKDIEAFVDELTEQAVSLESLNKILKEDNDSYYKSIGQD